MSSQPADQAPAPAAAADPDLVTLRLLCCIAWCDGQVSDRERALLESLSRSLLPPAVQADASSTVDDLIRESLDSGALETLVGGLQSHDQRLLALKLAYMVIRISQEPGDSSSINLQEKRTYRRLVEALQLNASEVEEAQWAAEQDLREHNSLWNLLVSRFSGMGAWPSDALLANPEIPGL